MSRQGNGIKRENDLMQIFIDAGEIILSFATKEHIDFALPQRYAMIESKSMVANGNKGRKKPSELTVKKLNQADVMQQAWCLKHLGPYYDLYTSVYYPYTGYRLFESVAGIRTLTAEEGMTVDQFLAMLREKHPLK